jgi:serine/threonine protein kinase
VSSLPCPHCDAPTRTSGKKKKHVKACERCGREPVVLGRYRIQSVLGRSNTGVVYEAVRENSSERVAVKVLPLARTDWDGWELFEQSTRVLMGLSHPALPRVHEFELSETGRLVLVRELFEDSLDGRLRKAHLHMMPSEVEEVLSSLLDLLGYLERMVPPVVHRNIQPTTIMFRKRDSWAPVLVDFEIVAPPPGDDMAEVTVGTPAYAAPEQLAGEAFSASDRYSLGRVLLFIAMHRDPGPTTDAESAELADTALGRLPASVREVARRLLDPEPRDRFDDAGAAAEALVRGIEKEKKERSPEPRPEPAPPPALGVVVERTLRLHVEGSRGHRRHHRGRPRAGLAIRRPGARAEGRELRQG